MPGLPATAGTVKIATNPASHHRQLAARPRKMHTGLWPPGRVVACLGSFPLGQVCGGPGSTLWQHWGGGALAVLLHGSLLGWPSSTLWQHCGGGCVVLCGSTAGAPLQCFAATPRGWRPCSCCGRRGDFREPPSIPSLEGKKRHCWHAACRRRKTGLRGRLERRRPPAALPGPSRQHRNRHTGAKGRVDGWLPSTPGTTGATHIKCMTDRNGAGARNTPAYRLACAEVKTVGAQPSASTQLFVRTAPPANLDLVAL
jgi:hypothetical protein